MAWSIVVVLCDCLQLNKFLLRCQTFLRDAQRRMPRAILWLSAQLSRISAMCLMHQACFNNNYPAVEGLQLPEKLLRIFAHTGVPWDATMMGSTHASCLHG